MKRFLSRVCAAVLALALVSAPAQAAEPVRVELDDAPLTFTDAVPLTREGRTYLPFRAIFEAMGAEVGWDAAARTVSAVRGGRTVELTLGETDVVISEDGKTTVLATDAAPFAQNSRTYVPVRFAAQAFDAVVGWDAATRTVQIVDAAKLLDSYDGAFTVLQKMLDTAAAAYPADASRLNGTYTSSAVTQTAMGALPVTMSGAFTGNADRTAAAFTGDCATDLDTLRAAITENEGDVIDSRIETLLQRFERFSFSAILNYDTGTQYLRSENLSEFGLSAEAGWAAGALPAYSAPLPLEAEDYVLQLAAAADLTAGDPVDAVTAVFDALSDAAAQDGVLTADMVTLTLSGRTLTVETDLGNGTTRVETLKKNRRSYTLTSVTGTRTETLTCDITLRPGGETPDHAPADN